MHTFQHQMDIIDQLATMVIHTEDLTKTSFIVSLKLTCRRLRAHHSQCDSQSRFRGGKVPVRAAHQCPILGLASYPLQERRNAKALARVGIDPSAQRRPVVGKDLEDAGVEEDPH